MRVGENIGHSFILRHAWALKSVGRRPRFIEKNKLPFLDFRNGTSWMMAWRRPTFHLHKTFAQIKENDKMHVPKSFARMHVWIVEAIFKWAFLKFYFWRIVKLEYKSTVSECLSLNRNLSLSSYSSQQILWNLVFWNLHEILVLSTILSALWNHSAIFKLGPFCQLESKKNV